MPQSEVIFYREGDTVPIRDWLKKQPAKVQIKCLAYIAQLEARGHELRRPAADFLRDGIYELRSFLPGRQPPHPVLLCGRDIVVVSHGLKKEREVPATEINRAIERKKRFEADPASHTYKPGK